MNFRLKSKFQPAGDQPEAIEALTEGVGAGSRFQTLLGVTGSGKTFTVANVIAKSNRPALVIAPNKTLAAQLCNEFREFFPDSAVEYFVSYYDYYQPEAYLPSSDTYIEKEAMINQEIDRLRHAATQALLTRRDVIIVASVSCIYGLGEPETYREMNLRLFRGQAIAREEIIRHLVQSQFERNQAELKRGSFRSRGDTIEIMPAAEETVVRVELSGGQVREIALIDPLTRKTVGRPDDFWVFPAKHFVTSGPERERALAAIRREMEERVAFFQGEGLALEAERLERRTSFDLAMLAEMGYCNGIENYSRHLSGREAGSPPATLLSYFPDDFLTVIDESHVTVPQLQGMFNGDAARKRNLIQYGFRLPSAADNRPLRFEEFLARAPQVVFTSATPGGYERSVSDRIVEQVIRPTGLVDPKVTVRPATAAAGSPGQVDDLILRTEERIARKERVLVTTLTKRMAEDLTGHLAERKVKVQYLHSDVETIDRVRTLSDFRRGKYDVLVGVNLLREGLDLPEVTLVAIMDADREGFLRSETSLIQTMGRAARNVDGEVILYADGLTGSMRRAIGETERRRERQIAFNQAHGITPKTIDKAIRDIMAGMEKADDAKARRLLALTAAPEAGRPAEEMIREKERQMKEAAAKLEFELAALLRDEIRLLVRESGLDRKVRSARAGKERKAAPARRRSRSGRPV